jgi:hypothetical protein
MHFPDVLSDCGTSSSIPGSAQAVQLLASLLVVQPLHDSWHLKHVSVAGHASVVEGLATKTKNIKK